jgi:hypothetical protein
MMPVILVLLATCGAAGPRQETSLNGQWEYALVDELTAPPEGAKWQPITVPGYLKGIDYKRAWLRRSFDAPQVPLGSRLKIRFGGVKYNSRVLVNGQPVGGCFNGYDAFQADITDATRPGARNELAVGVHDWTGIFTPGKVKFTAPDDWLKVRGTPRDKILAPIGGIFPLYGIWDDVTLVAQPAVYIKDLFIKPSVRRGELVVDYTLANESATDAEVALSAAAEDAGQEALRLPAATAKVPAGKTALVTLRQPWKAPHLWSYADPHLYRLRSTLSSVGDKGTGTFSRPEGRKMSQSPAATPSGDAIETRFGFREFWTQRGDFYLNGSKIHLLATSWWPPHEPATRKQIADAWRGIKRAGCVAFRTHTQPWPEVYYELADEIGVLTVPEGAVWNDRDVYRLNDPVFWDNYGRHLRAMVGKLKNHPSIVMWSLENEFYGGRLNDQSRPKQDLVRMGRLVKQCDPTRPIIYESDGDPGGVADVIGMHYPHEYPDYNCWPNEAYWLEQAQTPRVGMFLNGEKTFFWRHQKPLYIGEFLWVPSTDPSWNTVFFGDQAYIDYHRYQNLTKAEAWKMQILGYRHEGLSGISPWTMVEGGPLDDSNPLFRAHHYTYQHLAAYCHDYDRRFYAGAEVGRRLEVYNDILEPSKLTLAWTLEVEGKTVDQGGQELALGPGDKEMLKVNLKMPVVAKQTPARWHVTLVRDGKQVFQDDHQYSVWPPVRLSAGGAVLGLYDPKGQARKLFAEQGLTVTDVPSLESVDPRIGVLIIGPGAFAGSQGPLAIGEVFPQRDTVADFVASGGRLLVLEQDAWPAGLLGIQLASQKSTMTFPLRSSHPALAGLAEDDLKFWRSEQRQLADCPDFRSTKMGLPPFDHLVSAHEPNRPAAGAGRAIVVSGSITGIDYAPLLELPAGKGLAVVSQLKLVEKFRGEPAAGRILGNLLTYLAHKGTRGGVAAEKANKTIVIGGSTAYAAYLRSLGLRFEPGGTDLTGCRLVICRGKVAPSAAEAAELGRRLRSFVEKGGRLLLHRPEGHADQTLLDAMGLDLTLDGGPATIARAEGTDPLLQPFTREDLYWLTGHVEGWTGQAAPRSTAICDGMIGRKLDQSRAEAHPLMNWFLEGDLVRRQPEGIMFATNGTAAGQVDFPADGVYTLGVVARGTPCHGVFPAATVAIDGKIMGTVQLRGPHTQVCTVWGPVRRGRHKVAIAFTNDASTATEDRNLLVERLLVGRDESARAVALTSPAAAVAVRLGRGMVVVDRVRWDTEGNNSQKAARYALSLIGELGGELVSRAATVLRCGEMTPQKDITLFANRGGVAWLACNGYIAAPISVKTAGRYTMEVFAGGSPALGVYPLVEVHLDGKLIGNIQTTGYDCRPYSLPVDLSVGRHELRLAFVNDACVGAEDRNLALDKVVFYRE